MATKDFRIRLTDLDGNLIQNRGGSRDMYFTWGTLDKDFAERMLATDCREKGVELVAYTHDNDGIYATVRYLRTKR